MALGNNIKSIKKSGSLEDKEKNSPDSKAKKPVAPKEVKKEEQASDQLASDRRLIIQFPIEEEQFALPIDMVSEVIKTPPIAPVPQSAEYIMGVANVRGNVYAILDLTDKVKGVSKEKKYEDTYLLVINSEDYKVALVVDRVPDTIAVSEKDIDRTSNVITNSAHDQTYIQGIVKIDDQMIILIDVIELVKTNNNKEVMVA